MEEAEELSGQSRKRERRLTETTAGKAEEFATDEHGKTRKQQKQRHGRGRRIIRSEPEA